MRITELLEGKHFDDLQFVKKIDDEGKREINFDLSEDLIFFMHNNDDAYRKHLHKNIAKCMEAIKNKKKVKKDIFKPAIHECYKMYLKEFPIRELPETLDEKLCNEVCEKMHDEVHQHIKDGKYD